MWNGGEVTGGGFFHQLSTKQRDRLQQKLILLKIDANGDSLWSQTCGGYSQDVAMQVIPSDNRGVFIIGYTTSARYNDYEAMIVETEARGNAAWSRSYGTENWETVSRAIRTSDADD